MIRGVFAKIVRETWSIVLLCGAALMLVAILLDLVLPQIAEGLNDVFLRLPFVRTILAALLGTDLGEGLNPSMLHAIAWVHPVVLALLWGLEMVLCTRVPAGEIERGTIDVLLGWPISRRRLYLCESLAALAAGVIAIGMILLGHLMSGLWTGEGARPGWKVLGLIAANLLCVYVAVGGFSCLVSALSERRGRALTVILAFLLASFLLNFLAQFWQPAAHVQFLGVLEYYQPARILGGGRLPPLHVAVLLGFGAVTWVAGSEVMARRSICTV